MILDFHYIELMRHETKGSYFRKDGIEIYNSGGRELSVFISMDKRFVATIFRFYSTYYFSEVGS